MIKAEWKAVSKKVKKVGRRLERKEGENGGEKEGLLDCQRTEG